MTRADVRPVVIEDLAELQNGKSIKPGGTGKYPVYGSNGVIGGSDEWQHQSGIIIGRVGAYCGSIAYSAGPFWASDNTIIARAKASTNELYLSYLLRSSI